MRRLNPCLFADLQPEMVERVLVDRRIGAVLGKTPLPGWRPGEACQKRARRLAEQHVPRARLTAGEGKPVGLHLGSTGRRISPGRQPVSRISRTAATRTGQGSSRRRNRAIPQQGFPAAAGRRNNWP